MNIDFESLLKNNYNLLIQGFTEDFKGLVEEKKDLLYKIAQLVSEFEIKVLTGEASKTELEALDYLVKVAIPMIRVELRYKIEKSMTENFLKIVKNFLMFVVSIGLAVGEGYIKDKLRDELENIRIA